MKLFGDKWGVVIRSSDALMFKIVRAKSKEHAIKKARRLGEVVSVRRLHKSDKFIEARIQSFTW